MKYLNTASLIGKLKDDPKRANLFNRGRIQYSFTINTQKEDGSIEGFEVLAIDKLAKIVHEYLHDGDKVYVIGRLYNTLEDKTIVLAGELIMLGH